MNCRRILPCILCIFAFVSSLVLPLMPLPHVAGTSSAQMRSATVSNTNDSGPGSLRQAIADGAPTIHFDLTYPATIILTSGELTISYADVTITGPGSDLLSISANHNSRVFRVEAHPPYDINVSISGLTIQDGYTSASGGGLYVGEGIKSLALTDLAFRGNSSQRSGGGMFHDGHQVKGAVLTNLTFYSNSAVERGGGLCAAYSVNLTNVTFYGNSARDGGGLWGESEMNLINVVFRGNSALYTGGGVRSNRLKAILTNVAFNGNSAGQYGGAIYIRERSGTVGSRVQNSVLWGNNAGSAGDQIYNDSYSIEIPTISHSDIEGSGGSGPGWDSSLGLDGGGNLDADPFFLDPVDPASAPTTMGDLHLRWNSPAVDAGDNCVIPPELTTDLDGAPRIAFGTVDMGPYEATTGLHLTKSTGDAFVIPGQRITYTIHAFNATDVLMTGSLISDTLPPGLELAGPPVLDPPEAGVVGTALPILVSDLTISPGSHVTVTLPVTVQKNLAPGTVITNTASMTNIHLLQPRVGSCAVVIPFHFYLPVVAK